MEEYTVISLMNKNEVETSREVGLKVEQAWVNKVPTVSFDNTTIATSSISQIQHKSRPRIKTVFEEPETPIALIPDNRGNTDGPGYKHFLEMREKLIKKMSMRKRRLADDEPKEPKEPTPEEFTEFDYYKIKLRGEQAKSAMAHANTGIGYVILDHGKDGGELYCVAAYRQIGDSINAEAQPITDWNELLKVSRKFTS